MKTILKDGVYDITNETYHASEGVSRSGLWLFKQSPMHYWHRYLNPDREPDKPNPNFLMGELVHCLILEPGEFGKRYAVAPALAEVPKALILKDLVAKLGKLDGREEFDRNKADRQCTINHNDALMYDFRRIANNREIITATQAKIAKDMGCSVMSSDTAKSLFNCSTTEQSIYFTHKPTGLQVKVRPDAWLGSIIIDLKTTKSGIFRDFQSSAYHYGYYLQAAMMKLALESLDIPLDKFIFYYVEKTEPYASGYYILDDEALQSGVEQFDAIMEKFAVCIQKNEWPGYEPQILTLPNYATKD